MNSAYSINKTQSLFMLAKLFVAVYTPILFDFIITIRKCTEGPIFASLRGITPDDKLKDAYDRNNEDFEYNTKKFYYTYSPFLYTKKSFTNSNVMHVFIPQWYCHGRNESAGIIMSNPSVLKMIKRYDRSGQTVHFNIMCIDSVFLGLSSFLHSIQSARALKSIIPVWICCNTYVRITNYLNGPTYIEEYKAIYKNFYLAKLHK